MCVLIFSYYAVRQLGALERINRPMDKPIEPPPEHTIVFRNGERVTCRIDRTTIAQITDAWQKGDLLGAFDVEALDGSYCKLALRLDDVLYIGPPQLPHTAACASTIDKALTRQGRQADRQ
jgi:hypothetical protein